jgi:hypothetical protein
VRGFLLWVENISAFPVLLRQWRLFLAHLEL